MDSLIPCIYRLDSCIVFSGYHWLKPSLSLLCLRTSTSMTKLILVVVQINVNRRSGLNGANSGDDDVVDEGLICLRWRTTFRLLSFWCCRYGFCYRNCCCHQKVSFEFYSRGRRYTEKQQANSGYWSTNAEQRTDLATKQTIKRWKVSTSPPPCPLYCCCQKSRSRGCDEVTVKTATAITMQYSENRDSQSCQLLTDRRLRYWRLRDATMPYTVVRPEENRSFMQ